MSCRFVLIFEAVNIRLRFCLLLKMMIKQDGLNFQSDSEGNRSLVEFCRSLMKYVLRKVFCIDNLCLVQLLTPLFWLFQGLHSTYLAKIKEMKTLQDKCMGLISKQRYRIKKLGDLMTEKKPR